MVDDPVPGEMVVVSSRILATNDSVPIPLWPHADRHVTGEVVTDLQHGSVAIVVSVPALQLYGSLGFTQFVVLANGHVGWVFAHQVSRQ